MGSRLGVRMPRCPPRRSLETRSYTRSTLFRFSLVERTSVYHHKLVGNIIGHYCPRLHFLIYFRLARIIYDGISGTPTHCFIVSSSLPTSLNTGKVCGAIIAAIQGPPPARSPLLLYIYHASRFAGQPKRINLSTKKLSTLQDQIPNNATTIKTFWLYENQFSKNILFLCIWSSERSYEQNLQKINHNSIK